MGYELFNFQDCTRFRQAGFGNAMICTPALVCGCETEDPYQVLISSFLKLTVHIDNFLCNSIFTRYCRNLYLLLLLSYQSVMLRHYDVSLSKPTILSYAATWWLFILYKTLMHLYLFPNLILGSLQN